jgi:hypothetical protein
MFLDHDHDTDGGAFLAFWAARRSSRFPALRRELGAAALRKFF